MMKKCICKKCEDCRLFLKWNMKSDKGEQKFEDKCGLFVLFDEITRIRGSVDGLQCGVNEARNRSMDTRQRIEDLGSAVQVAIEKGFRNLIGVLDAAGKITDT